MHTQGSGQLLTAVGSCGKLWATEVMWHAGAGTLSLLGYSLMYMRVAGVFTCPNGVVYFFGFIFGQGSIWVQLGPPDTGMALGDTGMAPCEGAICSPCCCP